MGGKEAPTKLDEGPRAACEHDYPIVMIFAEGGCRARCLGCWAVGPIRKDSRTAHRALLAERHETACSAATAPALYCPPLSAQISENACQR